MRITSKAFTLMEVLLVAALMGLLGVAIYRSFANGLKLWARGENLNKESEVSICLDRFAEDLRAITLISKIPFKGTESSVKFPAIVLTEADSKSVRAREGLITQIGSVHYHFDYERHAILRSQANYSEALKGVWNQPEAVMASGIEHIQLHYEVSGDKSDFLKSEFQDRIPRGVVIEIHFKDDSGMHVLKRYLPIPVGG